MQKVSYVMITGCIVTCMISHAMDDKDKVSQDLVALTNAALNKAKSQYQQSDTSSQNSSTLAQFVADSLRETMEEHAVNEKELPAMLSVITEQFKQVPPLYSMSVLGYCANPVRAVDVSKHGTRALAAVDTTERLWVKRNDSWQFIPGIQHTTPITAVCLKGDIIVSTDQAGFVSLLRYKEGALEKEMAFKIEEGDYANMIALNDDATKLAVGNLDTKKSVCIYQCNAAYWNKDDAEIPVCTVMQPTALGWTADNTLIAYGKPLEEHASTRMLTLWQRIAKAWQCITNITFDCKDEQEILAEHQCILTRRNAHKAISQHGLTKVSVTNTGVRIDELRPMFAAIMHHLSHEWKKSE